MTLTCGCVDPSLNLDLAPAEVFCPEHIDEAVRVVCRETFWWFDR